MKKKINVGIIGRNFGYKVIFQSILKIKTMNVYGFSFKQQKKKINLPKKIKIYRNWKKLISEKKIQAIIISAPPVLHEEMILYAIKKNKHILKLYMRHGREVFKQAFPDGITNDSLQMLMDKNNG